MTEKELRAVVIDTATDLLVLDLLTRRGDKSGGGLDSYWRVWEEVKRNVSRVLTHVTIGDVAEAQDIVYWVVRLAREFARADARERRP